MRAFSSLGMPVGIGPPGTNTAGRWPNDSAPITSPGTILSQMPRYSAASNIWCDSATAVACAITSRENSDSSMPSWPCVTPSHIAGTPPANCAVAPASNAASLIQAGNSPSGWCAESMSLYEETIATLGRSSAFRRILAGSGIEAKPCARFVQDSCARCTLLPAMACVRDR
ncbi:hypothetical protein OJJOAM_003623 [Cupriavidus sp. H18C1]